MLGWTTIDLLKVDLKLIESGVGSHLVSPVEGFQSLSLISIT